jgi:hypothetical protein
VNALCGEVVRGATASVVSTAAIQKQLMNGLDAAGCIEYMSAYPAATAAALVQHMYIAAHNMSASCRGDAVQARQRLAEACVTVLTHPLSAQSSTAAAVSSSSTTSTTSSSSSSSSKLPDILRTCGVKEAFRLLCIDVDAPRAPFQKQGVEGSPGEVLNMFLAKARAEFGELILSSRPATEVSAAAAAAGIKMPGGEIPAPPPDTIPAAFFSLVSEWSAEERERLCTFYDRGAGQRVVSSAANGKSSNAADDAHLSHCLWELSRLHSSCQAESREHAKLSVTARSIVAKGWARSAAENLVKRAVDHAPKRAVAMLQAGLKKVKPAAARNTFVLARCRLRLSGKRGMPTPSPSASEVAVSQRSPSKRSKSSP